MEENSEVKKKPKKFLKGLLGFLIILIILIMAWIAFSLIGRIDAAAVIPSQDTENPAGAAVIRISIANPSRFIDGVLSHESLDDISAVPELAAAAPLIASLRENELLKNRLVRLLLNGKLELALLHLPESAASESDENKNAFTSAGLAAAFDLRLFSPLLRILPVVSNFITIPDLYYVRAGKNSRFEYRLDDTIFYIGPCKNILFVTDNSKIYEDRLTAAKNKNEPDEFKNIKIADYDAGIRLSHQYINNMLGDLDPGIAAILDDLEFDSTVEAGLSIHARKIDFHLSAPIASRQPVISRFLESRSPASDLSETLPASTQYATILSAGTLEELLQASFLFMPEMDETLRVSNTAARFIMGITIEEMLFSWSGKEFAAFGLEGRPHPVYAIQVKDERKRQEVFDKVFKSILLNEDSRLSLDGIRLPRIEIPIFLQQILAKWNINIPSPYYTVYNDFIMLCESADTLLSALRAMQRNDVLPKTENWRVLRSGKTTKNDSAAFSIYYSLDRSVPFFLRGHTALSGYLSLYKQGLVQLSFNRGIVDLSFSLVPGSGSGVTLMAGYPLDIGNINTNQIYGASNNNTHTLFFASGSTVYSLNLEDNSMHEISGQGRHWIIPADGIPGGRPQKNDDVYAWAVSDRGRVTLVNSRMEIMRNFPILTGLRISAAPAAFEGKLYLCDDDGNVYITDENANLLKWETTFTVPLISPPSFYKMPARGRNSASVYAAVYPKSFFGEIFLLDIDGKILPNWPASISVARYNENFNYDDDEDNEEEEYTFSTGLGFGSPLVFAHNSRVYTAFVCQTGELIIYDESTSPVSPFPMFLNNIFYIQPVFDGTYLWLAAEDGTLYRVSMEGELLYQKIQGLSVKSEGNISLCDIDNDKIPEIFITGEGNAMHAYTRNFRSLEGFPLSVWGKSYFIDTGKKAEIIGIGMDQKIYRWQFR